MDYSNFIKNVELFRNLTEEERFEISQTVEELSVNKDTIIFEYGTPGDALYIVKSGLVSIERIWKVNSIKLAEISSPGFFGEMSLIDDYPHSARAIAVENTVLLTIKRLDLDIILNWNTILGSKMWRVFSKVLSERLRNTNEQIFEKLVAGE